jgi:hypothetical protein
MTTEQTSQNFDLNLNDLKVEQSHRVAFASAGQLVHAANLRASTLKAENKYQEVLYAKLRDVTNELVTRFQPLLTCASSDDHDVRKYNLFGYSGKIKQPVFVKGADNRATFEFVRHGDIQTVLGQRLDHIANAQVPARYNTESLTNSFKSLQENARSFLENDLPVLSAKWKDAVTVAREAGGDEVQNNLKKRADENLKRREELATKREQRKQFQNQPTQRVRVVKRQGKGKPRVATNTTNTTNTTDQTSVTEIQTTE